MTKILASLLMVLFIAGCSNDQDEQAAIDYTELPENIEVYDGPNEEVESENILTLALGDDEDYSVYNLETQKQLQEKVDELKKGRLFW